MSEEKSEEMGEDRIRNELEKIKPRLALFRCVGIGLKNYSREMS